MRRHHSAERRASRQQRTLQPAARDPESLLKIVEIPELLELIILLTDPSLRWAFGVLGCTNQRIRTAVRSLPSVYDLILARDQPAIYGRTSWKAILPQIAVDSARSLRGLRLREVGVRRDCAGLLAHLQSVEKLTIFEDVSERTFLSCQLREANLLRELRCSSTDLASLRGLPGFGRELRSLHVTSSCGAGGGRDNAVLVLKGTEPEESVPLCAWAPHLEELTLDFTGSPTLLPNVLMKLLVGCSLRRLSLLGWFHSWAGKLALPETLVSLVLESRSPVTDTSFLDNLPGLRHLAIQVSDNRQYDWSWHGLAEFAARLESLRLPCAPRDLPPRWPSLRALGLSRHIPSLRWLARLEAPRLTALELCIVTRDQLPAIQPHLSQLTDLKLEFCTDPLFLESATQLRRLELSFCQVGARLTLPPTLRELAVRYCRFDGEAVVMVNSPELQRLEVRGCSGLTFWALGPPLPRQPTDEVWCQLNRLAVSGLTSLTIEQESVLQLSPVCAVLAQTHGLRELTITGSFSDCHNQRLLHEVLPRLQRLRFLSLPHTLLPAPRVAALSRLRNQLPHCAELVLT